jgi:flagellar P-ring protein precursor FlgI
MNRQREQISRHTLFLLLGAVLMLMLQAGPAHAERIKDLATVGGVRENQLVGYGLVVGLDGTGDQTTQAPFTTQSLISMLERLGVTIPAGTNLQLKNIAAVVVHASLPPFSKTGQTIDVTASSIANAKSLRGGTLLLTPLKGLDGQVYAIAQGNLAVGGLGLSGEDGSKISINIPSVGRVPNGATIEREVPTILGDAELLTLNLHQPDFTTSIRLADSINALLGAGAAIAHDPMSVRVRAPESQSARIGLIATIENLEVTPADAPARVIVNSRTGTVQLCHMAH